ncbi:hypothetical protein DENSPDRAFT_886493 [Dentipellis sp. KUC8613]|nr:hypothetical protein DENSPDRAFT_886493 [Dentipellis sp. KUC8613]
MPPPRALRALLGPFAPSQCPPPPCPPSQRCPPPSTRPRCAVRRPVRLPYALSTLPEPSAPCTRHLRPAPTFCTINVPAFRAVPPSAPSWPCARRLDIIYPPSVWAREAMYTTGDGAKRA